MYYGGSGSLEEGECSTDAGMKQMDGVLFCRGK
jgi:hypothetical protein